MANLELWKPWNKSLWKNPFRELSRMESAFDEMLERYPNGFTFTPSCEVAEEDNKYILKFDLPGIPKDQVKIELANNQLTVSAERKEEKKKENKRIHLEEFSYGSYMRTFTLPSAVDEKKVEAKYENGVLTITVPKIETSKPKQIDIH